MKSHVLFAILVLFSGAAAQTAPTPSKKEAYPVGLSHRCDMAIFKWLGDQVSYDPTNAVIWLMERAKCRVDLNDDRIIDDISEALKIAPDGRGISMSLLYANSKSGPTPKFLDDINLLMTRHPNNAFLYESRARYYIVIKNYDAAFKDVMLSLELDPGRPSNAGMIKSILGFLPNDATTLERYQLAFSRLLPQVTIRIDRVATALKTPSQYIQFMSFRHAMNEMRSFCLDWAKRASDLGATELEKEILRKLVKLGGSETGVGMRVSYLLSQGRETEAKYDLLILDRVKELSRRGREYQKPFAGSPDLRKKIGDSFFEMELFEDALTQYLMTGPSQRDRPELDTSIRKSIEQIRASLISAQ